MPFRRGRAEHTTGGILRGAATGATFGSMFGPAGSITGTAIGAGIGALGGFLGFGTSRSPEEERKRRAAELRRYLSEMREGRIREGSDQILGQIRGMQAGAEMSAARRAAAEGVTDTGQFSLPATAEIARTGGQAIAQLRREVAQTFDPLMMEVEMGLANRPIQQPFGEQLFDWVTDLGSQYFLDQQARERIGLARRGMEGRQNMANLSVGLGNFNQLPPLTQTPTMGGSGVSPMGGSGFSPLLGRDPRRNRLGGLD